MTAAKKLPLDPKTSYDIATAIFRAKIVANRQPDPNEIIPVEGRLHVVLNGPAINAGTEAIVFGESRIDIPEYKEFREKSR